MAIAEAGLPAPASRGVMLVALSAVLWSTVGIFTKGVAADAWTVLLLRGVFTSGLLVIYLRLTAGVRLGDYFRLGRAGWAAAIVGGTASLFFLSSFKHTAIANVAILYATTPFLSALFAWIGLREVPSRLTMIAACLAVVGVGIMVSGSLGTLNLFGDMLALVMVILISVLIVMYRRNPSALMMRSNVTSMWLSMIASGFMALPLQASGHDIMLIAGLGIVFAGAITLMTEGTRLIPASRAALIGTLETPLAVVWAWLILAEAPPLATVIGGSIVMFAVLWHIWAER